MTEQIGGLSVVLTANAEQMLRDIGAARAKLQQQTAGMQTSLNGFQRGVENTFAPLLTMQSLIAGVAGIGLVHLIRGSLDAAARLQDLSDTTGLTVETLQEFQTIGAQSGIATEQMTTSLEKFTRNVGNARNATGTLVEAMKDNNRELLENIRRAPTMEQALDIAIRGMAGVKDEARRAAMANDLFGRGGIRMAAIVSQGADSFAALREEVRGSGAVLSTEMVKQADAAADAVILLSKQIDTLKNNVILRWAPEILKAVQGWNALLAGETHVNVDPQTKMLAQLHDVGRALDDLLEKRLRIAQAGPDKDLSRGDAHAFLQRDLDDMDERIAKLQEQKTALQQSQLGFLAEAQVMAAARDEKEKHTAATRADVKELKQEKYELQGVAELVAALDAQIEEDNRLGERSKEIRKEIRTELEKQQDAIDELNTLYERGLLGIQEYDAALEKLGRDAQQAGDDTARAAERGAEAAREIGLTMASSFENVTATMLTAKNAALDFDAILRAIMADIIRIMLRKYVTEPWLATAFPGPLPGGGGGVNPGGVGAQPYAFHPPALAPSVSLGGAGAGAGPMGGGRSSVQVGPFFNVTAADQVTITAAVNLAMRGSATMQHEARRRGMAR